MSEAPHNLILGWSPERVNISYAVTRVLGMSSLPLSLSLDGDGWLTAGKSIYRLFTSIWVGSKLVDCERIC